MVLPHEAPRGGPWVNQAQNEEKKWYRTIVYNFILSMANTGMRTIEARNLRWRDVDVRIDKQGHRFCCLNVRGKNKYRELVAPDSVATYFERIKEISNATGPDDPVFSTLKGKSSGPLPGGSAARESQAFSQQLLLEHVALLGLAQRVEFLPRLQQVDGVDRTQTVGKAPARLRRERRNV